MDVDMGVDLAATRLALTILVGDAFRIEYTSIASTDPAERCRVAEQWIYRIVREYTALPERYDSVFVYVENPVLGRGGPSGTLPIAMIQGAIFAGAKRAGAHYVVGVNNQTWKARVCGKGNLKKTEVADFVRVHWSRLYIKARGNQDVCDSACIALHGRDNVRAMKRRIAAIKARRGHNDLPSVSARQPRRATGGLPR